MSTSPLQPSQPRTIVQKIWDEHVVATGTGGAPDVIAVDLHLVHEVTSPQAFDGLRDRGIGCAAPARRSRQSIIRSRPPIAPCRSSTRSGGQVSRLEENCREFGIPLHGIGLPAPGDVHVIGPERGLTQPGMTIVCGDSHTATHGASARSRSASARPRSSTCWPRKRCSSDARGRSRSAWTAELHPGVTAKDIILSLLSRIGVGAARGMSSSTAAPRSARSAWRADDDLQHEHRRRRPRRPDRPDDTTFEYVGGRPHAPSGAEWDAAVERWRRLPTDDGATFDRGDQLRRLRADADGDLGHEPRNGLPNHLAGAGPRPHVRSGQRDPCARRWPTWRCRPASRSSAVRSTSSSSARARTRASATCARPRAMLRGRQVAEGVRMLVVPGSSGGEAPGRGRGPGRGLREAGAEWREAGCSMCIAMNGDQLQPGQYARRRATATSRAGRARAGAPSSRARWRRPRRP